MWGEGAVTCKYCIVEALTPKWWEKRECRVSVHFYAQFEQIHTNTHALALALQSWGHGNSSKQSLWLWTCWTIQFVRHRWARSLLKPPMRTWIMYGILSESGMKAELCLSISLQVKPGTWPLFFSWFNWIVAMVRACSGSCCGNIKEVSIKRGKCKQAP